MGHYSLKEFPITFSARYPNKILAPLRVGILVDAMILNVIEPSPINTVGR